MTPYVTVVALVQNEAPNLREWMEHHRSLGVENFLLYDNDSTDHTAMHAIELGAEVVHWPGRDMPQLTAHRDAINRLDGVSTWAAFIDPDEYILPMDGHNLIDELRIREGIAPALAMNWCVFGTSGLEERPESTRGSYLWRASQHHDMNLHIKSIVQPTKVPQFQPLDPHHFRDVTTVDFMGRVAHGPFTTQVRWDVVRLNHYISRSMPEAQQKMLKRRPNTNDFYSWDLRDSWLNEVFDDLMLDHVQ
jgi:Glycosyltransferase family 92